MISDRHDCSRRPGRIPGRGPGRKPFYNHSIFIFKKYYFFVYLLNDSDMPFKTLPVIISTDFSFAG